MPAGWAAAAGAIIGGVGAAASASAADSSANATNSIRGKAIGEAENIANQPFQAYTGELTPQANPYQTQAAELSTEGGQFVNEAAGMQWNPQTMQTYMNPYEQGVLNVEQQNNANTYGQQMAGALRGANMTDAFGVGRSAADLGQLNLNYDTTQANTEALGMNAAYNQGLGQFNTDRGNLMNEAGAIESAAAGEANQGNNLWGIQQSADTANYNQFIRQQGWSTQQIQPLISMLGATGGGQMETAPSMLGSIAQGAIGGAAAGYGLGGMMSGASDVSSTGYDPSGNDAALTSDAGMFDTSSLGGNTQTFAGDQNSALFTDFAGNYNQPQLMDTSGGFSPISAAPPGQTPAPATEGSL